MCLFALHSSQVFLSVLTGPSILNTWIKHRDVTDSIHFELRFSRVDGYTSALWNQVQSITKMDEGAENENAVTISFCMCICKYRKTTVI